MATQICLVSVLILDRSFLLLLPLPGIDLRSWALNGFLSFPRSRTFYSRSSNGSFPVSLGQEVSDFSPRGRWVLALCLRKQWIFTCALWVALVPFPQFIGGMDPGKGWVHAHPSPAPALLLVFPLQALLLDSSAVPNVHASPHLAFKDLLTF